MGCVVNGPGESKLANIGISLPGTGELPVAPVYEDGKKTVTLREIGSPKTPGLLDAYVQRTYRPGTAGDTAKPATVASRTVIPITSVTADTRWSAALQAAVSRARRC